LQWENRIVKGLFFLCRILTRSAVAVTLFQNKLENEIFGHQCQAVDPEKIHDHVGLVFKPVKQQRPTDKNDILHIIKEKDAYTVNLFKKTGHQKCFIRYSALKFGVPSGILASPFRLASCSAS